jgi:phosphoribosylformimino-5-aminoimidazole carboxamide ribotide isomerase
VIVIPAVDLRDGRCVRLRQGRSDQETVFSEDPVAMAVGWKTLGAERLHVVDLDGAFAGEPRQTALVARIVAAVAPLPVQVGGGLRDLEAVGRALETGARWAVVGTRAALDPEFLADICRRFPQRIIVAVDARNGRVAVQGWAHLSDLEPVEFARALRDDRDLAARVAALLYTDVGRDGTGQGPNLEATAELARAAGLPIIASGGVARLDDLRRLAAVQGVVGCVVGHALYTGAIDLAEALRQLAHAPLAGHLPSAAGPRPRQQ